MAHFPYCKFKALFNKFVFFCKFTTVAILLDKSINFLINQF